MIRRKKNRAVALVVVLSVVVILTLIVVSLTVAMRMERQAAFYFSERARADLLAREGVEMSKIILSDAYGDTNNYVVSMPGRLMVTSNGANGAWTEVNLVSGLNTNAAVGILAPPDLNKANKTGDGFRQIDPLGGPMSASWIYVYQNGDRTTNAFPTISSNNPIIGRYAFWADDESTRVNLNTAWKPRIAGGSPINTNAYAHPSQVSLQGLSDAISANDADEIYAATKIRPLQTVGEVSRISGSLTAPISSNRFSSSPYNHSSDLNPWGEPKIVLTTKSNLANGRPYFDILTNQTLDPGWKPTTTVNYPKFTTVMTNLIDLLSRTNWPYFPNRSFAQKYKAADTNRIAQLALDIIEYVRSAESTNAAVAPIRTRKSGSSFVSGGVSYGDYVGTTRHPLLTEIALWISTNTNAEGYFTAQVRAELYLPSHYGIATFPIANQHTVGVQLSGSTVLSGHVITAAEVTPSDLLAGNYAVITTPIFAMKEALPDENGAYPPVSTNNPRVRIYFSQTGGGDIWEQGNGTGSPIPISLAPAATRPLVTSVDVRSTEIDDPRINKRLIDWKMRGTGNSFGGQNSIWKQATNVAAGQPPQDRDGGDYSDYSLSMPPPKGVVGNEYGVVASVSELGRVGTGIESTTNPLSPVQWRTLRLQPTTASDSDIPDWALMDLFMAPVVPTPDTTNIIFPVPNSTAGRVNLNTLVQPYGTNSKRAPLVSVLQGASTSVNLSNVVENVMTHTLANNGRSFGTTNFFKSVGEIAEIRGVSDGGESTEQNMRNIVGLANVRSGVFRVFVVGQSIQQTPNGQLLISATKSVETVLESTGVGGRFRSVTWRENPL